MNDSSIKRHQTPGLNQCFVYIQRSAYQRTTLAKTHNLFPILYLNLQEMSNITQFDRQIFLKVILKTLEYLDMQKRKVDYIPLCNVIFFFLLA